MLKKAVPAVAICSVLLVGCNINNDVPNNNETPMEEIRDDVDNVVPDPEVNTPSPTNEDGNGMFNNNNGNDGINGGNNGINDAQPNLQNEDVPNNSDGPLAQPNTGNEDNMIKEDNKK